MAKAWPSFGYAIGLDWSLFLPMRAIILAAGRGQRLRPLTDVVPKPLIEVGGKALITRHLENLAAAGIRSVVVNLAWQGDRIREHLGNGQAIGVDIVYSPEPPGALETAGGIRQALPLLGTEPFLVVSADVLSDYPYDRLIAKQPSGLAHLVMVDNPPHHPQGDFALNDQRLDPAGKPRLTYSGLGLFSPELFSDLSPGRRALRPVLERALASRQLTGEHYRGLWLDIGTPDRLAAARSRIDRAPAN
jgi:MurNAc alpha-1-phosphate uridylyltransferase